MRLAFLYPDLPGWQRCNMNLRGPPASKDPQLSTHRSLQESTVMILQVKDKIFPEEISYGEIRKELDGIINEIFELKSLKPKKNGIERTKHE